MLENPSGEKSRARKPAALTVGPMFPRFRAQEVGDDCVAWVIDVAREAAVEWNTEPWRWIVVRDAAAKKRLESASPIEVPLCSAPVILICLSDTLAWKSTPQRLRELVAKDKITEEQGRDLLRRVQEYFASSPEVAQRTALADGLVAVQRVLLGAASCGLAAYWLTEFDETKIKTHFHIPDQFAVAALVSIGYREDGAEDLPSKPSPRSVVYQEKFGKILNP